MRHICGCAVQFENLERPSLPGTEEHRDRDYRGRWRQVSLCRQDTDWLSESVFGDYRRRAKGLSLTEYSSLSDAAGPVCHRDDNSGVSRTLRRR